MKPITFFDTEYSPATGKFGMIGSVKSDGSVYNNNSLEEFFKIFEQYEIFVWTQYIQT
jgi:hypothetical protein